MQSRHLPDYRAALDQLGARGLVYPCFCTRADIQQSASRRATRRMARRSIRALAAPCQPTNAPCASRAAPLMRNV